MGTHARTHTHAHTTRHICTYTGSISLVVLGIGSTQPGLLQYFIDKFSLVFPDYRERVTRHGAFNCFFIRATNHQPPTTNCFPDYRERVTRHGALNLWFMVYGFMV